MDSQVKPAKWDLASKTQLVNILAILLPLLSVKLGWVTKENITAFLQAVDMSQDELMYCGGALIAGINMVLRKFTHTSTTIVPPWLRK